MDHRPLGQTGLQVSQIGFGAFKIGRNQGIKYPATYDLPDDHETAALLNGVLDLGINLVDTAPAYGLSEERIGKALATRNDEFIICTKAGEVFADGVSHYDYSEAAIRQSVERSLRRLGRDVLDIVLIHSNGEDLNIIHETAAVSTLQQLQQQGKIRAIGFSGKMIEGTNAALPWADVVMVTYNLEDRSHDAVIRAAEQKGIGVLVKKGFSSGQLDPAESVRFILDNSGVSSLIVGSLNLNHVRANIECIEPRI